MKIGTLPRSAMIILEKLVCEGPLTPSGLHEKSNIPLRTISHALKELRKHDLCKRQDNLADMRQPLYYADRQKIEQLKIDLNRWRTERRVYFRIL